MRRVVPMLSSSELSSHQKAHPNLLRSRFPSSALIKSLVVLSLRVPLELKGCTRTSTLFSPTTPSGASVLSAFFSHSALHFDLGVEQACSAAVRVLLTCPSRASPSSASSRSAFLSYEAFPHAEVRRLWIRASCGSALPSSGPTSSFLSSSMRAMYMYGGGRMCFPVRDCWCLPVSHCICHRSCPFVPRSLFLPGRPDVFSWPRLCTTSSPLLHRSILLIPTSSSRASMVWTDTVFGVARLAARFEARRWFSGCRLHPRARSQETGQATPGVYLACLVLCVFKQLVIWGGAARAPRRSVQVAGAATA